MRVFTLFYFILCSLVSWQVNADVPIEPTPNSLMLPKQYPLSWMFALGMNNNVESGNVMLLDVAAPTRNYKGVFAARLVGNFVESKRRSELYVAQGFYSRGTYGKRTDVITISDKRDLRPIAEILLPEKKRGLVPAYRNNFQLTSNEHFGLLFNFTPAASVTVIDMEKREVVSEVPIPGCSLIYPTGERGFSTLCANGTMVSINLDRQGQPSAETVSEAFNDIDGDPLFMHNAVIKGVAYFPSFKGRIQPINLADESAVILPSWSLLDKEDRAEYWRPSGQQLISSDRNGRLYILMRKEASDGDHYEGGQEVWVFNALTQRRLARIPLEQGGYALELTQEKKPHLVVANFQASLEVYDSQSGQLLHTIGGWSDVAPVMLHSAK